jgi:hypothetical protein
VSWGGFSGGKDGFVGFTIHPAQDKPFPPIFFFSIISKKFFGTFFPKGVCKMDRHRNFRSKPVTTWTQIGCHYHGRSKPVTTRTPSFSLCIFAELAITSLLRASRAFNNFPRTPPLFSRTQSGRRITRVQIFLLIFG